MMLGIEVNGKNWELSPNFNSVEIQCKLIDLGIHSFASKLEAMKTALKLQLSSDKEFLKGLGNPTPNLLEELLEPIVTGSDEFLNLKNQFDKLIYNTEKKVLNELFPLVFKNGKGVDFYDHKQFNVSDLETLYNFFLWSFQRPYSELAKTTKEKELNSNSRKPSQKNTQKKN